MKPSGSWRIKPSARSMLLRAFIVGLSPFDYLLMVTIVDPPADPRYDKYINEQDKAV